MIPVTSFQEYPLFGGLTRDQMEKILPLAENEEFGEGSNIIVEGNQNDRIRFITEGRVAVVKQGVILTELGEGDTFGEMEVLDIMASAATVRALSPTRVSSISNKALHDIRKIDTEIFAMLVMNLARDISRRIRKLNDMVVKNAYLMDWN